jgi:prepilin-type N-terminal cleavage/methylation domain-containing protein
MKREIGKPHAFTLVELLVVISLIGLLVSLLIPTVSMALLTARKNATQKILKELGMGIEAYHTDFGDYPRSRGFRTSDPADLQAISGAMQTGAANLVYYLRGPAGSGWGTEAGGRMPYDTGTSAMASRPNRAFGPYYQTTPDAMAYGPDPSCPGQNVPAAFLDAFKPAGRILYFRYEPRPRLVSGSGSAAVFEPNYRVRDNDPVSPPIPTPGTDGGDADARVNYGDQTKFDEIVQVYVYTTIKRHVRKDYLLASPGPDGRYGWVIRDSQGNLKAASRLDENNPTYDDVTNW